jgi:hypothetical protein
VKSVAHRGNSSSPGAHVKIFGCILHKKCMTKGNHMKGEIDLLTELMEVIISDILKLYLKDGLPQLRSSPLKELRILAILPLRWVLVILNILNSKKQNLDELRTIAIEI